MNSVIIVDYNSLPKTIEYIKHISNKIINVGKVNYIIIDNGYNAEVDLLRETFGTGKKIELQSQRTVYEYSSDFGEIIYCSSGGNIGYAKGNNLGAKIADELFHSEYLIVSNNDIIFDQKLDFNKIRTIFEMDSSIAVVGPRVITKKENTDQSPSKKISAVNRLILSYWINNKFFKWKGSIDYDGRSKKCYFVIGCLLFVKSQIFWAVDGFDENTFMYSEEMILSERLAKKGYCFYFYNDYCITHDHGSTVKKSSDWETAYKWMFESYCYCYKTYRGTSNIVIKVADLNFKTHIEYIRLKKKIKTIIAKK